MNDIVEKRVKHENWMLRIFLASMAVRAALMIYAEINPAMFDFADSHRYRRVAYNIQAGLGPIEDKDVLAGTDPLFPYVLAAHYAIGGKDDGAFRFARYINGGFGLFSLLILAAIAKSLFDDRTALIAFAIFAFDPILLFFHALALTEAMYLFFMLLGFLVLIAFRESGRASTLAWCAVFLGLGTLTRSTSLLMPLFLVPFVIGFALRHHRIGAALGLAVAFCSVSFLMITPTLARNYRLFGHVVPVRTGGGASLMEALGPWADGAPGMDRIVYPSVPEALNEHERDLVYRKATFTWLRENPGRAAELALVKLKRTWSIVINASDYTSVMYQVICWLTVAPAFGLALVGAWRLRGRKAELMLLLVPAVYFTLIHMVFVGSVRYRVPAMPFVFVLAAFALSSGLRGSGRTRPS